MNKRNNLRLCINQKDLNMLTNEFNNIAEDVRISDILIEFLTITRELLRS